MGRKDAIAWVVSACASYARLSQAKTLAAIVAAAVSVGRVSLAALGRAMPGDTRVKHQIKRVHRFLANEAVEPLEVMRGVVPRVLRRWPASTPLLVSFDWTDVRQNQTLMAAAVVGGGSTTCSTAGTTRFGSTWSSAGRRACPGAATSAGT